MRGTSLRHARAMLLVGCRAALVAGFLAAAPASASAQGRDPTAWSAPEVLVPPSSFSGVHGVSVDGQGNILAASVLMGAIFRVDRETGAVREIVSGPDGQADDVAVGPGGELAWTSPFLGIVHYRERADGPVQALATGLHGVNGIGFDPRSGRLYASQTGNTGTADTVLEIDRTGSAPPRIIARDIGSLNGFEVGADGMLYGALMFRGQVVRLDPADGRITVIADGFSVPTAASPDGRGNVWVVDSPTGRLVRVEIASGRRTLTKQLKPAIDNLTVAPDGTIYVSNMADNSIEAFDPATGETRVMVAGRLSVPGGFAIEGEVAWIADVFGVRTVDLETGSVTDAYRRQRDPEVLLPVSVRLSAGKIALTSWISNTVVVADRVSRRGDVVLRGLRSPFDALLLDDRTLVYAEYGAGRVTLATGADFREKRVVAEGLDGPVMMALGRDGALYVTEAAGRLTRLDLSGKEPLRSVAEGLSMPEGLAQTARSTWIVADAGARRLTEIDPATGTRRVVADGLPIGRAGYPGAPPPFIPTGVAIGNDGSIYVSSDIGNAVFRIRLRR